MGRLIGRHISELGSFLCITFVLELHRMCRAAEHHQKLLAPAASTEASLRLFLQLLLAWVAAGAQYRVPQQVPDTKNQPNKNSLFQVFIECTVSDFTLKCGHFQLKLKSSLRSFFSPKLAGSPCSKINPTKIHFFKAFLSYFIYCTVHFFAAIGTFSAEIEKLASLVFWAPNLFSHPVVLRLKEEGGDSISCLGCGGRRR